VLGAGGWRPGTPVCRTNEFASALLGWSVAIGGGRHTTLSNSRRLRSIAAVHGLSVDASVRTTRETWPRLTTGHGKPKRTCRGKQANSAHGRRSGRFLRLPEQHVIVAILVRLTPTRACNLESQKIYLSNKVRQKAREETEAAQSRERGEERVLARHSVIGW
jgi:hypothetical protein